MRKTEGRDRTLRSGVPELFDGSATVLHGVPAVTLGALLVLGNALWGQGGREEGTLHGTRGAEEGIQGRVRGETLCQEGAPTDRAQEVSVPASPHEVWEGAWKPFRELQSMTIVPDGETWVSAVDSARVFELLRVSLEEIERCISDIPEPNSEDMDVALIAASRRAASRWLGYVPSILATDQAVEQARENMRYQLLRVEGGSQRAQLYARVMRLLGANETQHKIDQRVQSPVSWVSQEDDVTGGALCAVAPAVLHDMAMTVADHVCGAYVSDVVSGVPETISSVRNSIWPVFLHPKLVSTRDIQGFVNRLYLRRLADEYYYNIVAIYEDTLPLHRIAARQDTVIIQKVAVRTRRAHELSALRGLKYVVSLLVESFDVVQPMVATCREWMGGVVTWLLREVVGKGIGFVWEGMKKVQGNRKGDGNLKSGERPPAKDVEEEDREEMWPGAGVFV